MSGSIYSRSTSRIAALLTAPILLSPALASMAFAGSATWSGTGTTDWNVTTNWTPAAIPNGPADIATFGASFTHSISLSASTQVNGIVFASSATSPYTITTPPAVALTISGAGITNNSGVTETFETRVSGAFSGLTRFSNSASAGTLTHFNNYGGLAIASFGGVTQFKNSSTADHASFINVAGQASGAFGGYTEFDDNSTAASAFIVNQFALISDVTAGFTWFRDTSTAGSGTFRNNHGGVGRQSGFIKFNNNSNAGNGTFQNDGATSVNETSASTNFYDNSNAGLGIFSNVGGYFNGPGGLTTFADSSSALFGTFFNDGGPQPGAPGGNTVFYNNATASFGTFANYGGTRVQASGGETKFYNTSTAGQAEFDNYSGTVSGADGGYARFFHSSSAGTGTFTNNGAAVSGAYGGTTSFQDNATAGGGTFINNAGTVNTGVGGYTLFYGSSTAGTGNFTNNGAVAAGALAGVTQFGNTSSAGQGTFTNNSGPAGGTGFVSGITQFVSSSNAGSGTFTNNGGNSNGALGGVTYFFESSTAAHGTFTNKGGTVSGAKGGLTDFNANSTAGDSTLDIEAGMGGGAGGSVIFRHTSDGGTARAILAGTGSAAGGLDLSLLTSSGMGIGSIEGAGIVSLGTKTLTVGGNNLDTVFSGIIRNSGSLTKVGTGALTLSGANTYTGGTTVNNGTLIVNGSIAGNAEVKSGATLKGTGSIAGVLTCEAGSVCAPGTSPGTLTLGGLNLMSGSTLEFELGATRDHIVVTSQGDVSLGGVLNISLLDGFIPIEPFALFEGSIETLSGAFSRVNAPIFNGHTLAAIYSANQVTLHVVLAGDFNGDGIVDAGDYIDWRKGLGTTYTPADYDVWRANFGATAGSGSEMVPLAAASAAAGVPEPFSIVLLLVAVIAGGFFRVRAVALRIPRRLPLPVQCDAVGGRDPTIFKISILHRTWIFSTCVLILTNLGNGSVYAVTHNWVGGSSVWSAGGNWSPLGVPAAGDTANISIGGTPRTITYDYVGPAVTLGLLTIDKTDAGTAPNTLSMSANNLTANSEYVGPNGRGVFEQTGGTNTIAAGSGFLDVGVFAGSKGTYNLSGTGSLVVNTNEYIGDVGTGVFNQTGGTNTISGSDPHLYLGYNAIGTGGTYNLSGGALSGIDARETVGRNSVGTFNQSGGTNEPAFLTVAENATGTYTLSGGTLSILNSETVGLNAAGTFNHTGGTHYVASELDIGGQSNSTGKYTLSGTGALSTFAEYIGFAGPGTFIQTAGTHSTEILELDNGTYTLSGTGALTVTWKLVISNLAGNAFNFNGGTINAAALDFSGVPTRFNWTSGTLNLTQNVVWDPTRPDSTSVVFGSLLTLGANKTLVITGNETLGGTAAFGLTLNSGSTHYVTGGIMLGPTGTIIQNAGSTLTYSTFTQAGGAFNGTLQNHGKFIYQSGQFNGQMVNNSGAYLVVAGEFSASNLVNNGDMVVINTSISGPVVNSNAVTVVGTVDFNGPVSGPGNFFGPGTAHFNGGIAPGASPAHIAFEGNVTFGNSNTLVVELGGTAPGTQYDQLQVAGAMALGGTLRISLIGAFTPTSGQSFNILDWETISGTFSTLQLPALAGSLAWNTSQLYTAGVLSIGLPGDYNANGVVDAPDYVVWRKSLGTTYAPSDFDVWRSHFGQTTGGAASVNAAVPEPATITGLLLAIGCVARRGSRSESRQY